MGKAVVKSPVVAKTITEEGAEKSKKCSSCSCGEKKTPRILTAEGWKRAMLKKRGAKSK